MKKSELRVWALRTHSPDEWWVDVNGTVHDSVVTLDEAFRRAEGATEAFIVHASLAEETDDPHWIKMGAEDLREDEFGLPNWVCRKCRFPFEKPDMPSPSGLEILGYLLIVPGILMTRRRKNPRRGKCPHCGSRKLVAGNSRAGRILLDQ